MIQNLTKYISKVAEWIGKQDSDISHLQESKGFTAGIYEFIPKGANLKNLRKLIESYGNSYYVIVREPSNDGFVTFPEAINSKYPIVNLYRVLDYDISDFIEVEIEGFHLIESFFYPFSTQKRGYKADLILATKKIKFVS